MPCGKRPAVKKWDRPKNLTNVKPSRYQQNESSVKLHWRKVLKELELLYKDDKFWETQSGLVRELVGEVIFERLIKIFHLPERQRNYEPPEEDLEEIEPSENYYTVEHREFQGDVKQTFSFTDFDVGSEEGEQEEEESDEWSVSSIDKQSSQQSRSKQFSRSKTFSKSDVKIGFSKSKNLFSKQMFSKQFSRSSQKFGSKSKSNISPSSGSEATSSDDDIKVHPVSHKGRKRRRSKNVHFELLYCNHSETDMIKWNSNYKQEKFEVSASDEFSKKAELLTKQIAHDFFTWWTAVGSADYKSEIKRPNDIEDLFQVWFDEHASRGLVLDPKIMPCVLESIANAVGAPKAACPKVLNRQIAFDIRAETSPAHTKAFGSCLPKHMKHIPPRNNTKQMWRCVKIPEDLRTMACVWENISHLTSTKSFRAWLQPRPHMPMPQFFKGLDAAQAEKKQLFVVPSDFIVRDKSFEGFSAQELNLPVSQFSLEIKEVLSRMLND